MKALVLKAYNEFEVKEVADPRAGPSEVLIRVHACGICGSDVHGMDGSTGRRQPPIIMGHEAAGIIESVGEEVSTWRAGDRVTFDSTIYCGSCNNCRTGRVNLCDARRVLGVSCDEYRQDGAFAECIVVPEHILYRVPDGLSLEHAALAEPAAVAAHAVGRALLHLGDTAVVIGAGMIGLLILQMLRARGCGRIVAVDVDSLRLELALKLGADFTVNASEGKVLERVLACTGGQAAHIAYEAVGRSETVDTALHAVRKGGAVVLVGNVAPRIDLALQTAVTREITLHGSCASSGEYPIALNLMASGAVQIDPLISAVAPLEDGPAWFRRLYERQPGLMKVLLTPQSPSA